MTYFFSFSYVSSRVNIQYHLEQRKSCIIYYLYWFYFSSARTTIRLPQGDNHLESLALLHPWFTSVVCFVFFTLLNRTKTLYAYCASRNFFQYATTEAYWKTFLGTQRRAGAIYSLRNVFRFAPPRCHSDDMGVLVLFGLQIRRINCRWNGPFGQQTCRA